MNPHDITSAIKKAGTTQPAIAAELGITKSAVNVTVRGINRSARVERHIAHVTGYSLAQLWPQWHAVEAGAEQSRYLTDAIPARLIAERERLELMPYQMAVLGDVLPEELASYETGESVPSALFLAKLARSTHFDALYVITGRRENGLGR